MILQGFYVTAGYIPLSYAHAQYLSMQCLVHRLRHVLVTIYTASGPRHQSNIQ